MYSSLLRLTGARRLRDGLRLWGPEPNSPLKLCLCQLNVRLGKAETEFRARTLQSEGRERSRGFIVESLPLIGSNYQLWLFSPIIHMTSVDSIPSSPGHHPQHSQCILQVNYQSAQFAHIITRWQVLLVSPPPQADNGSMSLTDMVYNKPFSPWKPGDAYSVESDISDLRLLLGSVPDGLQSRSDKNYGI